MTPGILMLLNLFSTAGVSRGYSNPDGADVGTLRLEKDGEVFFNGEVKSHDYDIASKLMDIAGLPLSVIGPFWKNQFLTHNLTPENRKEWFFNEIEDVLKGLHYEITKNDGQYIEAFSTHVWCDKLNCAISVKGKRKLNINYDTDRIYFGIREDWDTRNVYNGTIEDTGDIVRIDALTKLLPIKKEE